MPDTISLRAYLARLEEQFRMHATDEVVHHCRHILQYFPKHADTYRLLGRALLYNARWDEATAVMRRVLAVYPDDKDAHVGLAEVYSERNQGNQAIWHLERAFEQDPNNEDLIASLRDFYKRFQGTDYHKIQLTAGAIARQYVRNGLYEQGIDTVRRALDGHEDRVDLQVLLAQMLWGGEQYVEAAEVALDVLALLPDCLEANRILTQLWLAEDRPSDAQRYLNHIEAVDPYTALELATGTQAPDNAFTLPELDYRRYAESVLTTNQPDWLQDIGEERMAAVFSEPVRVPRRSTPEPEPVDDTPDESTLTAVPDDWLTDTDKARLKPTPSFEREDDEPDFELRFDDVDTEGTATSAARELRLETSTHANIYNAPQDEGNVPDWLADSEEGEQALPQQIESSADPLAWLRDSGIEIDESEPAPVEIPKFEPLPPDEEDPMAWLQDSGIELFDEPDAAPTPATPDAGGEKFPWMQTTEFEIDGEPKAAPADVSDDDLFAWMQDSDIDADGAAVTDTPDAADDGDDEEDPLAWMRDSGLEIDDDDLAALTHEQPVVRADDGDEEDPLAWLRDSGVEIDEAPAPQMLDPYETADETPIHDPASDPLGWMADYDADIVWDEAPTQAAVEQGATPASDAGDEDENAWMYERGVEITPDAPGADSATPPVAASDEEDDFRWLQDETLLEDKSSTRLFDEPATPNLFDDAPDDSPPKPPQANTDEDKIVTGLLRRLGSAEAEEKTILDDEAAAPEGAGDFEDFMDVGGSAQAPAPQDAEMADRREAMSDKDNNLNPDWNDENAADSDRSPDWLRDFEVEDDAPAQPAEDVPEWLAALGPNYVQPESAGETSHAPESSSETSEESADDESDEASFTWASDIEDEDADVAAAQPNQPEDFPAWLQAEELAAMPEADDESNPDWLADFQAEVEADATADEDAEPAAVSDVPDWLSELQPPEASGAPVAATSDEDDEDSDESFGWLDQMIEQEEAGTTPQPVAESEDADEPAAAAPDWLPDFESEATEADAPMALDMPDWLNNLAEAGPMTDETPESDEVVTDVETFTWSSTVEEDEMSGAATPDEEVAASVDFSPPEAAAEEPEPETEAAPQSFAWTNEFDKTAPMAPVEDDTPEWLKDFEAASEADAPTTDEATVVTVQPGEQPEWLSETLAPVPVQEAPEAEEAASTFDEFEFEMNEAEETPEPEEAVSALDEFEFEMSEADETPELESEHRPAQNAPDWLNAMVPGVDLDYATDSDEAPEPEPAEPVSERRQAREFEWLVDIVEEETQPAPGPAVAEPEAPRFAFSKLPAWLRGKQAAAGDKAD